MALYPMGVALMAAATADSPDRARAAQLTILGGLVGRNPASVAMLAVAANQGRRDPVDDKPAELPAPPPTFVQVPAVRQGEDDYERGGDGDEQRAEGDEERAKRILRRHGLVPVVARATSEEPLDGVIDTVPPVETYVRLGSTVTLLVSAGFRVPKVVGLNINDAVEAVREAGFTHVQQEVSERTGRENVVEAQEPDAGTFADAKSTIVLTVFKPRSASTRVLKAAKTPQQSDE